MTEIPLVEVWVPGAPWMESWLTEEQQLDHQRQLFHDLASEVGMDEAKERWDDWEALVVEAGSGEVPFPEEDWEQLLLDRLQASRTPRVERHRDGGTVLMGRDTECGHTRIHPITGRPMSIFTVHFFYPTELEDLDEEQTIDAWKAAYLDLVVQIGEERAKEHYTDWQDWVDEETGEVGFPEEDWNIRLLRGFQAQLKSEPITVLKSVEDLGVEELVERLKSMAAARAEAVAMRDERLRIIALDRIARSSEEVVDPWPERNWQSAQRLARNRAWLQWIVEMHDKYEMSSYRIEVFHEAGVLTGADHRYLGELEEDQLMRISHLNPNDPSYAPHAGTSDRSPGMPDEARGVLVSDLLGVDDRSIAADLNRIETELRGIREELGDSGAP